MLHLDDFARAGKFNKQMPDTDDQACIDAYNIGLRLSGHKALRVVTDKQNDGARPREHHKVLNTVGA